MAQRSGSTPTLIRDAHTAAATTEQTGQWVYLASCGGLGSLGPDCFFFPSGGMMAYDPCAGAAGGTAAPSVLGAPVAVAAGGVGTGAAAGAGAGVEDFLATYSCSS